MNTIKVVALLLVLGVTVWGGYILVNEMNQKPTCYNVEVWKSYTPKDCNFDEVKGELKKICVIHYKDGKLFGKDGKPIIFWHYTQWKGGMVPNPEVMRKSREADNKILDDLRRKNTVIVYIPIRGKHEYLYPKADPIKVINY